MKIESVLFLLLLTQANGEDSNTNSIEPHNNSGKECTTVCSSCTCCGQSSGGNDDYESCTPNKRNTVRYDADHESFQVCDGKSWKIKQTGGDILRRGLVGYWPMDEETGSGVADFSGYENHASSSQTSTAFGKYGRGRYFNSNGVIRTPSSVSLNFGTSSFTMAGWAKILDTTYPLTTFSVRKGFGCYFGPGRDGWFPGWEIAHGHQAAGTRVCIRDHLGYKILTTLEHDSASQPSSLIGKWVHYAFVYDREQKKIYGYINGKQQQHVVDISIIVGSVDNEKNLEFGEQYGWKTKGTLDEYRLYNRALKPEEIQRLYKDSRA